MTPSAPFDPFPVSARTTASSATLSDALRQRQHRFRCALLIAIAAATLFTPASAANAVIRSAAVRITVTSPTTCDVSMVLALDRAPQIEHRVQAFDGTQVEVTAVSGARQLGAARSVGQTRAIVLQPDALEYTLAYRVSQPVDLQYRCPLWLPVAPTGGTPGDVRLEVDIPTGSSPGDTLPAFAWTGTHGTATLAHLPAVVRVSYGSASSPREWTLGRTMEAVALTAFAASTALWLWRVRR